MEESPCIDGSFTPVADDCGAYKVCVDGNK